MYYPHFKKTDKGIPILSKVEIDAISERYAVDYMPHILEKPQSFNIDGFTETYLGLKLDFQYLSHDGRYLGMTIFNDTDRVVIYLPEANQADYIHVDHGTIIVDNSLLKKNQEHRYRFTLGHECAHWIFHGDYFGYDLNQMSLFKMNTPFIQCRETNKNYLFSKRKSWDDSQWMEWHADKFSAGILMPKTAVHNLMKTKSSIDYDNANDDYSIRLISDTFNVSKQAAYLRLYDLGYFQKPLSEENYKQLLLI